MKKTHFLGLIIMLIIGSCAQEEKPPVTEEKSPLEGAWKLVYGYWHWSDRIFPDQVEVDFTFTKLFTEGHVAWLGRSESDTLITDSYGGGPYKFEGNRCEVIRQYHSFKSLVGTTSRLLTEIRNDTLIQKFPADENWMLPEQYSIEKYIRLE